MNKNIFMFLSVALIMLIPVPGRFAYALVMIAELLFLVLLGTASKSLLSKLKIEDLQHVMIPVILMAASVFFKQFVTLISPMTAFVLGYIIYLPAVCAYVLGILSEKRTASLSSDIKRNLGTTLSISLPIIIVFLVRDLLGYGTLTLPSPNGIFAITIIPKIKDVHLFTVFLASIPGSFVSLAACTFIINKFGLKWNMRKSLKEEESIKKTEESPAPYEVPAAKPLAEKPAEPTLETIPEPKDEKPLQAIQETTIETVKENEPASILENPFDTDASQTAASSENRTGTTVPPDAPSLLNLQKLLEETDVD